MKYLRGFLMAWGNFCAVPCPYHKWHDESRKAMLSMLPIVGILLAVIAVAAWWILDLIGVPYILTGVLVTAIYFCSTGFIHMDGFMDCSDAILSRRPELAERQRILKASDVGAFAVISVMLMILVFAASMITLAEEFNIQRAGMLAGIMIISRSMAADSVLRKPTMKISQYADIGTSGAAADGAAGEPKTTKKKAITSEDFVLSLTAGFIVFILPQICNLGVTHKLMDDLILYTPIVVVLAAAVIAGKYVRKQLGGMNGDIAGYMVVMSEMFGMLAAALMVSVFGI